MFLQVFLYLIIAFGIIVIAMTMFEKEMYKDEKYIVFKKNGVFVNIKVETKGLNEKDARELKWILKNGKYETIYDIANEFNVISIDKVEE